MSGNFANALDCLCVVLLGFCVVVESMGTGFDPPQRHHLLFRTETLFMDTLYDQFLAGASLPNDHDR